MKKRIPFGKSCFLTLVPSLLIFSIFLFAGSQAFGVTKTSTGTTWNTGANWSPAGVPASGDDVIINSAMVLNVDATVNSLVINTTRSLNLAGFSFTVSGTTTLNGNAVITDNNNAGSNIFIGLVTNGTGTISSANNSTWEFRGGIAAGAAVSLTGTGAISFKTNNQTVSGVGAITLNNLSVPNGITITNSNTGAFTVSTTSTIDGTLSFTGASGLKLFTGTPTISGTGSLTSSTAATFEFRNGIVNNGTVSLTGAGAKTFSTTASQSLTGSGNITLNAVTINASIALTNTNTGVTTFNGAFALNGTFTDGASGGSNVFGGLITIPTGGSLASTFNSNYDFRGGITTTGTGFVSLTGTTSVCSFTTTQTINHLGPITLPNIAVSSGTTLLLSNTSTFTVNGTTTADGLISVTSSAGLKLFTGAVTISATGALTNSSNAPFQFRNGITHNGTSLSLTGTGGVAFTTNTQTIGGTSSTTFSAVTIASAVTIGTPVSASSLLINSGNTLNFSGASTLSVSGTSSISGNLVCNTTGTVTLTGAITQSGTLNLSSSIFSGGATTLSGTATITDDDNAGSNTFTGLLTIPSTSSFSSANNSSFNFAGGIATAGTFNLAGTGTITLTATQTISGAGNILIPNLTISAGTTTWSNTGTLTNTGTSSLTGSLAITAVAGGLKRFDGLVTVSSGTFSVSNTAPLEFRGGIDATGIFSQTGSGALSFTTNNQTISGAGAITFHNLSISSGITITNSNTAALTVTTTSTINGTLAFSGATGLKLFAGLPTISGTGSLTSSGNAPFEFRAGITNNGTFSISGTGVTTFSTTASQTIQGNAFTFGPVTVNTGITVSTSGTIPVTINGNLVLTGNINFTGAGTTTLNASTCSGAGSSTVQNLVLNGTTISQTGTFTVLGTTTSTGTSPITATAGLKQFRGLLTVTSGTFSSTNAAPLEFQSGITNNGTFTISGTGITTFPNSQTIQGNALTFGPVTVGAGTLLSAGSVPVTINGNLILTGNIDFTGAGLTTLGNMTVSGAGNITLQSLAMTLTTTITQTGTFTVLGTTSSTGTSISTVAGGLKRFDGLVTISSGTFSVSNTAPLEFRGGIAAAGAFSQTGTGAVAFNGAQTISGAGAVTFTGAATASASLTLDKSAGAITFGSTLTVANNLTLSTASSATVTGVGLISGNLIINPGSTLSPVGSNFTVTGTTDITGSFTDATTAGLNRFDGLVTLNTGGSFTNSSNPAYEFRGGITNNGTFAITGTGLTTFSINNQILQGNALSFVATTIASGITVSSSGAVPVTFNGNLTTTGNIDFTGAGLTSLGNFTVSGAGNITLQSLAMTLTTTITQTGTFTVLGTTSSTGTTISAVAGGLKRFDGLVTISSGTFSVSNTAPLEFGGGIIATGTFNQSVAGAVTFTGAQMISGAGAVTFTGAATASSDLTLSKTAGTVTFNAGLAIGGNLSLANSTTGLTLAGTASSSVTGTSSIAGTMTCSTTGSVNLTGAITVTGALNTNNSAFTAGSTFDLSGTGIFSDNANGGSNIFTGQVTVGAGCSFSSANSSPFNFRNGISNSGTSFSLTTPTTTFSTNNQAIGGTSPYTINTISIANITLTNNGTLTIGTACDGTTGGSSLINGVNANLTYNGVGSFIPTGTLNATANGNTVTYSGAAQNIRSTTGYYNLSTGGSSTKTILQNLVVSGDLTVANATTFQGSTFDVTTNNLIIAGTFSKSGTGAILVSGLTTLSGTGTISGITLNPTWEFRNGITQNSSGASNLSTGTTLFSTNNQSINGSGAGAITFGGNVLIGDGITVTNSKSTIITGNLDGTTGGEQWTNANGAALTYAGINPPFSTTGSLDASAATNIVTYNGTTQTILSTTYHNLTISGTNVVKTIGDFTVNGDFIQTTGTLTSTIPSTQTFASTTSPSIVSVSNGSFYNMTVNKSGAILNLNSTTLNVANNLTINAGSLTYNTGAARTITVTANLSGLGSINMSANAGNVLTLNGSTNAISGFTTVAGNTVNYNRAGDQTVFASANYRSLNFGGSGTKLLTGNITVSDTMRLTVPLLVSLGSANLTLNAGGRIKAGTVNTNGSFSVNQMIVTNGSGSLIINGNSAAQLTGFSWSSTSKNSGVFPLGTIGFYSPATISGLTATVAGTGSISMKAVPIKQPNVPYYNNALVKYWDISTTNLSAIAANISFIFNAGEVIGSVGTYEPRVWNGSTLAPVTGPSAPGSNPFSTTGTTFLTGAWTAIDPTVRNAFYSYVTGDWNTPGTWTTDPSGTTSIDGAVPGLGDQVFILNGRTVTNSAAGLFTGSLDIENGAVLDLGPTTGHSFGPISGSGLLRQSTVTLPTANFTDFTASSGGTFEYYDLPSGVNILSSALANYNNLVITNSTGSNFSVVQDHNITINGNLSMAKTGAGTVTFTLGNSTTARTLNILGNLTVATGTTLNVGLFNTNAHVINLSGNLTNSGTITLNNIGVAYGTPTTGAATINFLGRSANTTFTCNSGSSSKFYTFVVNKNLGYELFLSAASGASPLFWANANTFDVLGGTFHVGSNVTIPSMGDIGGNYDLGSATAVPTLWVDGANITFNGSNSIVLYGTLRVTAGSVDLTPGSAGTITIRDEGQLIIEGGTVSAKLLRTSTFTPVPRGSYFQSGGTFNLNNTAGGWVTDFAVFNLGYPDNVFKMSGGTINITRSVAGGTTLNGGILIASSPDNFEVTGGTVNVTITPSAAFNFDICSTAPFYNLTISRNAGAGGTARLNGMNWFGGTASAQPLVVLNNFTINGTNAPVFDALNSNVTVGGNFTINSGGTYQSTANTTTFNGSGAQTFSVSGSLGTGLSSWLVNKPGSILTLAGTLTPFTVRANVTLTAGTLADAGKTINVGGNIVNNGTHSGTGKIVLNSSTTGQTISGTTTSIFGNLDFSNTNGAAGSTQITVSSNLQINGNLGLTTDRIANIGNKQIILTGSSAITGTFSNNRHIKTNGLRSDGGIKKTYSSTAAVTFPLGYGTNYAPATIQFSATPTTWGALTVRPAGTKQLYVTDPNCFDLYWKVETSGFTGVPANSVNHTFNYGNLTDDVTYIPAFYDQLAIAYIPINDVTKVNEATNEISFTGVSYTDGDYTAGNPAAFGIVIPYYSRANGDWNTPSTWSNVAFGGAAAAGIPSSNSPVLIGNGGSFNHSVSVNTNGTISGSLIVDAGSTLDCQTTTGNNFGAIPYATAGGSGKIRISSSSGAAAFPAGDFGLFFQSTGGLCEYYTTGSQDFTIPSVTDAPNAISIDTYKNLLINPGAGRTITMPDKNLQIFNNLEVNGSSTGKAILSNLASRNLTIENNLLLTSGQMELGDAFAQTVYVKGNATIASNGGIQTVNTGAIVHNLNLDGNLFNEGSISFNNASKATLTFQGPASKVFNGSNAGASVSLSGLVINKGTSSATDLEVSTLGSFSAPSNNWLTLTNGNLKWSKSGSITLTNTAGFDYTIPSTGSFTLNNSGANVAIADVNAANAKLKLVGDLTILAGTINIGNSAYNQSNDLEYASNGIPELSISGSGVLNVNGQIRRSIFSQFGSLKYTQSGTSTVTIRGKSGTANLDRAKLEILNSGSQFNMSGNSTLIIDRVGAASGLFKDLFLDPSSYSVTGGEIKIGTSATTAAMNFLADIQVPLNNLTIDGTTTSKSLTLNNNPLTLQNTLRIEGGSSFIANSLNVTIGGNLVNQNPLATTGVNAGGYQAGNSSQVTTFSSSTASQSITGVLGNLTNFGVLTIQNSFSGGQITLGSNTNLQVNGQLNLNTGTLNTGANLCTTLLNVVNNSAHTSTGTGFLVFGGSVSQSIESGSTANFGSIRISNSAGVVAESPVTLSGNLNIANGIFYINNNLLSLGASSAVTGLFSSSNMIRVNGVTSDAGVTKSYPAGAHDFTFPIGVTLKYTPVRFNVTSNTVAGTITLKSVDTWHPATTDPADKELEYYWRVSSTGFNGSTVVTHTYFYEPLDVRGNEASYVTGRFLTSTWAPNAGIASTVDAINHKSTLTGVNYFDGDFTVGETTEFGTLSTFYSRNATLGGNWDDPNSWSTDATLQHAGAAAFTFPNFNQAEIAAGHTIDVTGNTKNAVSVVVNGTLNLGNTIAHNFGTVSGTGRIQQTATATNQYLFPGGDYSAFITSSGGTFEFGGTTNGTISTQSTYNNVELTGSASKNLPNANITVNGNLTISAGVLTNPNNKNVSLMGNWVNTVGVGGFSSGSGAVNLNGGSQTLTGSTNFYNLVANGAGIKTLTSSLTVTNQLTLSSGVFSTGANQMIVNSTAAISGGSATSYVSGNLSRGIPASATTTVFQIGDATAYTPVTINYTGTTIAGGFITANTSSGDHPQVYTSGIDQTKSANRNWSLTNSGVTGFTGYNADFTFIGSDLDVSTNPLNFMIARYSSSAWTQPTVGTITSTSTQGISISGTTFGDFQVGQSVGGNIWTGATNSNWNLASNWIPASVPGAGDKAIIGSVANQPTFTSGANGQCKNLKLLSGANITIPTGYTLTVNEDIDASGNTINGIGNLAVNGASTTLSGTLTTNAKLIVNNSAALILGAGSALNIGTDLTVNGSITPNSLPITFVGLNNSTVTGNIGFYDLVVNKTTSSSNVTLGSNITVSNQVNLISGNVELNGFDLNLGSTGSLVNETASNRVTGLSGGTIRATRNLNAPSDVDVAGLGAILSSSANMGSTEVIRKHNQVVFGIGYGMNRRYEIHPTNNSSLNAKLVFNSFDDELVTASGTIDELELDLWRFNGTTWDVQLALLDDIGNTITKTGIPQFSEWTGASEVNNPLPIELAYANISCEGIHPTINWKTLKESDTRSFQIETSPDGKNWEILKSVSAAGNSNTEREYMFELKGIPQGTQMIRLSMLDVNNKLHSYDRMENCSSTLSARRAISIHPNPTTGVFTIDLKGTSEDILDVKVINTLGQTVGGAIHDASRRDKIKIDLLGLPSGIYKVQISGYQDGISSFNIVVR